MYEKLLPIGSVVLLKNADKRLMIIGRLQTVRGDDRIFDYSACYYPEGMLSNDTIVFFNDDDIDTLFFVGFQDPEELRFREEVLGNLGELYVNEDGEIAEREAEDEELADEGAEAPEAEAAPKPAEEIVETAVFADVE